MALVSNSARHSFGSDELRAPVTHVHLGWAQLPLLGSASLCAARGSLSDRSFLRRSQEPFVPSAVAVPVP